MVTTKIIIVATTNKVPVISIMHHQQETLAKEVEPHMGQIMSLVTIHPVIIFSHNIVTTLTITAAPQYITNSLPTRITMVILGNLVWHIIPT